MVALVFFQNVPVSSRGPTHRLESVTPNRLVSDYGDDTARLAGTDDSAGEFRRSSSARLHRNKRNHSDLFEQIQFGQEESRRKEQVRGRCYDFYFFRKILEKLAFFDSKL
jgi:hypothetical protein